MAPSFPGFSPGTLTISGAYTQTVAGELDVEISGAACDALDQVVVSDTATLNGTLNVAFLGGCIPQVGDTFQIMTHDARAGTFSTVNTTLEGSNNPPSASVESTDTATTVRVDAPTAVTVASLGATPLPAPSAWMWATLGLTFIVGVLRLRRFRR